MKENFSLLPCISLIAITLAGCHHNPSPWDGHWTFNKLKSQYAAPTFSVAISPSGEYRVDNGAFSYSFRCDGKQPSSSSGPSTACTQISERAIALKGLAEAGANSARWELAADGKTLTINTDRLQIDGSGEGNADPGVLKHQQKVFERISGSSGFEGQWRETKPLESLPPAVVLILNYDFFHFEDSEAGQFSDSRAGGPPSPIRGANQPDGFARSVQIVDPRQLHTEDTFEGRVIQQTTWKVSDDGRTLTVESWTPAAPTQKNLLVYQRP